jgi:ethylmalonyl-CoA/methylmalonyl-CoA decarboxylase
MTRRASIQFVQLKMGVTPGWGGGTRLTSLVGRRNALRLLIGMPVVDAVEAHRMALCDFVTDASPTPLEDACGLISDTFLKAGDPSIVREMKRMVHAADTTCLDAAFAAELDIFGNLWGGPVNQAALAKSSVVANSASKL